MLTAQVNGVGLINPTDYWSTARSGGRDGLGSPIVELQPEAQQQIHEQGFVLPHRGEMMLYHPIDPDTGKRDNNAVDLTIFSRGESYSTWIAVGAGVAGLLAGVLIGRITKR